MATKRIERQGVVLSSAPYGESDRIVRLYTERAGKLSVLVKGAKSRHSSTVALTETFTFGLYRLSLGKTFYYLNSGKILQANLGLRENYDLLIYASALVEIVDKSSMEGEGTARIFSLIRKALHELSLGDNPLPIFLAFLVKYLSFMGYRPMVPEEVEEGSYVFIEDRGIVKADDAPYGTPLEAVDIYTFRHLLYTSLDKINLEKVDPTTLEKMYRLIKAYAVVNLELGKIQSLQLRM
ncbi:MAG: DNA repair protein RecO [Peptoniphilus sp.]|nr:DNA repair protein RecO [Peptoniphilus sp.]MDY3118886.1 DNA repair protein RecO [Peptoniphilus sp.]